MAGSEIYGPNGPGALGLIAESAVALASDAAANVASRRTLGAGALQAVPGDRLAAKVTVAASAPSSPAVGDVWIDTSI